MFLPNDKSGYIFFSQLLIPYIYKIFQLTDLRDLVLDFSPFLYRVADRLYAAYGSELYLHRFVFPNRRAAMFMQKYFADIAGKPLFSPTMITIQELFASFSPYRQADRIEMLTILYNHFIEISGSDESFDNFLYWGEMLLNDFDDVDKYMVDAAQVFKNLHSLKSLDDDFSHLDKKQIEAIGRFWKNFIPTEESRIKKKFRETWMVLYDLYCSFRNELHNRGSAYEGMIFREVAERAGVGELFNPPPGESFIFIGFNLLTPSEVSLLESLKNLGLADFYWDYESPLIHDGQNSASLRVKENLSRFPSKFELTGRADSLPPGRGWSQNSEPGRVSHSSETVTKTKIELIGVPSGVGQAKHVTKILEELIASKAILNSDEAINSAVVLPDEKLLLPVLYSIPEKIDKINVTMGYSLSYSSVAGLVEHILLLQNNLRSLNGETAFYHRFVRAILNYPIVAMAAEKEVESLKQHIIEFNRAVVPVSEIPDHPLLKRIFNPIERWEDIADYLQGILSYLYKALTEKKQSLNRTQIDSQGEPMVLPPYESKSLPPEYYEMIFDKQDQIIDDRVILPPGDREELFDEQYRTDVSEAIATKLTADEIDAAGFNSRSIDLEREFIVKYYKTITRLQDGLREAKGLTTETYFRLLKKLTANISVSFSGEPLSGLQIMGVLETRLIDFENLIIMSMNEGIFPAKNSVNSFIPYTLRRGFNLPTYEHQESIYSYYFYRMISRAKRVYMLYDTRSEGVQTGEVSRYFYQLKYLYGDLFEIDERVVAYDVTMPKQEILSVEKTGEVMKKLNSFRVGGERYLSASGINNYIDCPIRFYFTTIEKLSEESEVQESIEFDLFGSLFHQLMESLYGSFKNREITGDLLRAVIKNDSYITEILEKAFARHYFRDRDNPRPLQGQFFLIGEILRSYLKQTIQVDMKLVPFRYLESEYLFKTTYQVNSELNINFTGFIDRIDKVGDSIRIVDYKSGTGELAFKKMEELFDGSNDKRPGQILQVFLYGLFYIAENPGLKVSPSIYYLRQLFKDFKPEVCYGAHPISDLSVFLPEFKEQFNILLEEMFDPTIPFAQTTNDSNCRWCAFKELCNR